ncbi:hypothetical protein M1534_01840 [Patescibacteria group bacterium]|nr:hypothetical protein [Patescibacteria group bacterium]
MSDSTSAGNKGALLGELFHQHIPVPPGFVVLNTAFERFLRYGTLEIPLNKSSL